MKTKQSAADWWAALPMHAKTLFHELGKVVVGLKGNERLRLQNHGTSIEPILINESGPGEACRVEALSKDDGQDPDRWWNGLMPAKKKEFFCHLDDLMREMMEDAERSKIIEIKAGSNSFTARLILLLKPQPPGSEPRGGKAEVN